MRFATRSRRVTVVAPAQHLLADFRLAFPSVEVDLLHIPNGVVPPSREVIVKEEDRRGVVWYARSGAEQSIDSFLAIARAAPELKFIVIGQNLDTLDLESVSSIGWVSDPYTVLGASRVFLNTSLTEGMPNMALQALACGMHVVGLKNRGMSELAGVYGSAVILTDDVQPDTVCPLLRGLHQAPLPTAPGVPSMAHLNSQWEELVKGVRP